MKRKMPSLPFFLFLFTVISISHAQVENFANHHGVVLSGTDSSALPYVHVHVGNTSVGVVTNFSGQYQITFEDTLKDASLVFSCIGYKKTTISISEILKSKTQYDSIFLTPDTVALNEVIIIASEQDTIETFLKKVIERIPFNYPIDNYFLTGFYRQISQNGDSSSRLIEAAISIQDPGYSANDEKIRIKVDQMRKSNDYVQYSWTKSLVPLFLGTENDLVKTYKEDFLRKSNKLISGNSIFKYDLRLDSILGSGENQIAKIIFHSKEEVNGPFFEGEVYVSLVDLAINRISYSWIPHPKFTFPNQDLIFYDNRYRLKIIVEYHKVDSKYYPFFISSFEPIAGVTGAKGKLQFKESIIMINEIRFKKSEYSKIKRKDKEDGDEDIYEKEFVYDNKFWQHYNIAIINPIKNNQRFSLERIESLEEQYKKHGKSSKRKR